MTHSDTSHFAAVSRRSALSGALGAALLALAGCSNDDSALSGSGTSGPTTAPSPTGSASPASSAASPSSASSSPSRPSAADKSLPTSATLSVSFTFAAAAGGRLRNPYIAVWIENAAGDLVKTVALWHEDRGGQDRWLGEMKAFAALSASDAETVSSATRQPGAYTVEWDGSTLTSARAVAGSYTLFIEAAREHGPYELVRSDISLGSKAATFALTPSGELTQANASYAV